MASHTLQQAVNFRNHPFQILYAIIVNINNIIAAARKYLLGIVAAYGKKLFKSRVIRLFGKPLRPVFRIPFTEVFQYAVRKPRKPQPIQLDIITATICILGAASRPCPARNLSPFIYGNYEWCEERPVICRVVILVLALVYKRIVLLYIGQPECAFDCRSQQVGVPLGAWQ